jgi:hypothetical protein
MYIAIHRVRNTATGKEGINAFKHMHGLDFMWPQEPWRLPTENPGILEQQTTPVKPGGNEVLSYLDVLSPDAVSPEELDLALTGLWLELVADERGPDSPMGSFPNPVVYQRGRVVLRFGVEGWRLPTRSIEFSELRRYADPATAIWDTTAIRAGMIRRTLHKKID